MQRIIKHREVVDDRWHLLPKDAPLESVPNSDDVIIPLNLWLEHGPALRGRDGGLGVWLDADEEPEAIAGDLLPGLTAHRIGASLGREPADDLGLLR